MSNQTSAFANKVVFKLTIGLLTFGMLVSACSDWEPLTVRIDEVGYHLTYEGVDRLTGLQPGSVFELHHAPELSLKVNGNFVTVQLIPKDDPLFQPEEIGSFFEDVPGFREGISFWRYEPWKAWTRPVLLKDPSEIHDWDVQFMYWQYADGLYGAAMPLSGHGFRTTLGQESGKFGAKSSSYVIGALPDTIPQMILGFGSDPYLLFRDLFEAGLEDMDRTANQVANKSFPEKLDYIGWCTWNASENGKKLNEEFVVDAVKTFTDHDFPLGWVIIDDGWFDKIDGKINSFAPDETNFPQGFAPMIDRLKKECDIREVGVWHTLNALWNGINPNSELGKKYENDLYGYYANKPETADDSLELNYFIKPEQDKLLPFYRDLHQSLKTQGFSFLKVDNQLVTEKMALRKYPIFDLSTNIHQALNHSADEYFDGAVINCMDMTSEAYLNFGSSAIARASEDYFPAHDGGAGYDIPYGNAAVHLVMAIYNSIYFQQMVFPDFDMFESYNPDAEFHAVARAINNGPVYITDKPGQQNFDVLRKLCYSDGALIRPDQSLTPSKDCLFQLQEAKPFKAFSIDNGIGLLGVWNMANAELVTGTFSVEDLTGLEGEQFMIYEYFSQRAWNADRSTRINLELDRMEVQLYYVIPTDQDVAVIGLIDKYNAPGTVVSHSLNYPTMEVVVADHGQLAVVSSQVPTKVMLDGKTTTFTYASELLMIDIPKQTKRTNHKVVIEW